VYIYRRGDPELEGSLRKEGKVGYKWRFESVGDFAAEVERQFKEKASTVSA
jgi:hypothetical protein